MHLPHCPFIITMTTISTQSTNRTVFTFVGDPTSVVEAALAAAKVMMNMIVIASVIIIHHHRCHLCCHFVITTTFSSVAS